jgi:hypothetical protein
MGGGGRESGREPHSHSHTHKNTYTGVELAILMHIKLTTYSTEYRIQNKETHVHKITDVAVFYMALGLDDFDGDKSSTQAMGRDGPSNWICPHQNHYVPPPFKQQAH